MKPIYEPRGKAKEYGDYAINIYTGCPHRCYYCFAPGVLHRQKEEFHLAVYPRNDIVAETRRQLEREPITGKLIHLCFTCDPYPTGYDSTPTREIIQLLKDYGNHVQILTKGDGSRDFDLLDENDWYGITITGRANDVETEPGAIPPHKRLAILCNAKMRGLNTWVSLEPVIDADAVLRFIGMHYPIIDKVKIGKLNYHQSEINWREFGLAAEAMCEAYRLDYYIKDSLRAEMDR